MYQTQWRPRRTMHVNETRACIGSMYAPKGKRFRRSLSIRCAREFLLFVCHHRHLHDFFAERTNIQRTKNAMIFMAFYCVISFSFSLPFTRLSYCRRKQRKEKESKTHFDFDLSLNYGLLVLTFFVYAKRPHFVEHHRFVHFNVFTLCAFRSHRNCSMPVHFSSNITT